MSAYGPYFGVQQGSQGLKEYLQRFEALRADVEAEKGSAMCDVDTMHFFLCKMEAKHKEKVLQRHGKDVPPSWDEMKRIIEDLDAEGGISGSGETLDRSGGQLDAVVPPVKLTAKV